MFYNAELKEEFLSNYNNSSTREYYSKTLEIIEVQEKKLYKDIKDFDENQLLSVLSLFEAKTLDSLDSRVAALRRYLDYCQEKSFITQNLLREVSRDIYEKQVAQIDKSQRIISSREELYNVFCNNTFNAQDAVIFVLLFEGIKGEASSEIINLKIKDIIIDENKIFIRNLNNDEIIREVIVDKRSMEVIKKAMNEEVYIKSISNEENLKAPRERALNITSYLLRTLSQGKKDSDSPVSWQIPGSRLKKVVKSIGRKDITMNTIHQSGIFVALKELHNVKGCLTTEDYKNILEAHGGKRENYYSIKDSYSRYF